MPQYQSPNSKHWFDVRIHPSGTGLFFHFHDITERKHAEERLAYHALLLENVHDAIVATDERLVLTVWNQAAEAMYGWTEQEVLGRDIREVVRSEFDPEQRAEGYRVLAEAGYFRAEAVHHRKDGTPFHIEGGIVALRDAAERVTGYVYVFRDITERKRAEAERVRLFAQLQRLSASCCKHKRPSVAPSPANSTTRSARV